VCVGGAVAAAAIMELLNSSAVSCSEPNNPFRLLISVAWTPIMRMVVCLFVGTASRFR